MGKTMSGIVSRAKSDIKRIYAKTTVAVIHNFKLGRRAKLVAPTILLVAIITVLGLTVNTSYAYAVSYDGETIGYVSSEDVYTEAMESITAVADDTATEDLRTVHVEEEIAVGEQMMDAEGLSKAIVEKVETVSENVGLFRDGQLYVVAYTEKQIQNAIDRYIGERDNGLLDAKLDGKFTIKQGVYSNENLFNSDMLYNKLVDDKVSVCGYREEVRTEKIAYTTETRETDKYSKGETVTVRSGKNGKMEIREKVYYNGKKVVSREEISSTVKKQPISRRVYIGTGEFNTGSRMSFPFTKGTAYNITSYYGEARYGYYHMGVDIIASYATPIHATAGGTVLEAGELGGGWGIGVVIDHGNGIRSRYAHCSSVDVTPGQKVGRGEKIAQVGSTGYAECDHLHLEVLENGARVDPFKYIR